MGSGEQEHEELALPLGELLAHAGVDLLTGGGRGIMTSVCRAFTAVADRKGLTIGILPGGRDGKKYVDGYPNAYVELPIQTHLPHSGQKGMDPLSRNHINALTPNVIIALPGGSGTASEVRLAKQYGTPVYAFLGTEGKKIGGLQVDEVKVLTTIKEVEQVLLLFIHK